MAASARSWLIAVAVTVCAAAPAWGNPEERFAQAQARFDEAKSRLESSETDELAARRLFFDAAREFAGLYEDGVVSANVCVNAGNAYYFAGDEPRALLWYLRAFELANTPETRSGVATLRAACEANPWPKERTNIRRLLMSWHYDLSRRTKQIILLATYPVGCLLGVVSLFAARRRLWWRLGLTFMLIGGVFGLSDLAKGIWPDDVKAIVLESVDGRAGDGESYSVTVDGIAPGQEVKLIETRPEWVHVELPSKTRCWVPAEACEPV